MTFSPSEISGSWARIARRSLCNQSEICVEHLRAISEARPEPFADWLSRAAVSRQFWASQAIDGRVYGKRQMWPSTGQLRAILPMRPIVQLLDVLLSARLQQFITSVLPPEPRLCVGAVPGSQVLDITHSFQLLWERFADDRSTGGLAQGDIATYYDTIGVLRIARDPRTAGLDRGIVQAVVLMQMCAPIRLSVVGVPACGALQIPRRTWGSLTGTRVAGALGRWPTETTARELLAAQPAAGVRVGADGVFALAVYVDNLYALGASAGAAATLLRDWAELLQARWSLRLKSSSRECMAPALNSIWHDPPAGIEGCALVRCMSVLGHVLACDGDVAPCVVSTERALWRAYWRVSGGAHGRMVGQAGRLKQIGTVLRPIQSFRSSRWPASLSLRLRLAALQRRIIAAAMRTPRIPGEALAAYCRRRARLAGVHAERAGPWERAIVASALSWAAHVSRRPPDHWVRRLLFGGNERWLQERRLAVGSPSAWAGRLALRLRGPVRPRWAAALRDACADLGMPAPEGLEAPSPATQFWEGASRECGRLWPVSRGGRSVQRLGSECSVSGAKAPQMTNDPVGTRNNFGPSVGPRASVVGCGAEHEKGHGGVVIPENRSKYSGRGGFQVRWAAQCVGRLLRS